MTAVIVERDSLDDTIRPSACSAVALKWRLSRVRASGRGKVRVPQVIAVTGVMLLSLVVPGHADRHVALV
jgi:hypothetical protein